MKLFASQHRQQLRWLGAAVLLLASYCLSAAGQADMRSAVCRIYNQAPGQQNVGSGTLIDCTDDGRQGLVLTCAHLFSEGVGTIVVDFPGINSHGARLVGIDHQADLAALAIANPSVAPVPLASAVESSNPLSACGFGSKGQYRCITGRVLGQAAAQGQQNLQIDGSVRSGDSGGGVFNHQGKLVAVIWGESQGVTYASSGRPLQQFLDRVLGRPATSVFNCPNGVCPLPRKPAQPDKTLPKPTDDPRFQQLQAQIDRLQKEKQERGDYLQHSELSNFAPQAEIHRLETEQASQHESLLGRIQSLTELSNTSLARAAGTASVGLLGLSGPAGWAVLAATTLGGWWLGNRTRKTNGARGRRRQRFPATN